MIDINILMNISNTIATFTGYVVWTVIAMLAIIVLVDVVLEVWEDNWN